MKSFRFKLGHVCCTTVTVQELRELLASFPDDMPVMAEWEGETVCISPSSTSVKPVSKGHPEDACECLIFNVDGY